MNLTDDEKRILDGAQGSVARRCMEFLVAYGEAAAAERLVDVDGTVDLHPGSFWVSDYSISPEEIEDLANRGEKFKVPTFANKATAPGFIYDGWQDCGTMPDSTPGYRDKCLEPFKSWIKMGMIPTFACNSYLVASYLPGLGQHSAWVESSAIPWVNSVLGSRSNFDGCFQTAYLGKVPAYDLHLDERRVATVLVECAAELTRDMDYDLFGFAVGEAVGLDVPAFVGVGHPTTSQFVKMNSALATGGQVYMYHIPGVTPEAPTLEAAFKGAKPKKKVTIDRNDLKRVYDLLNYGSTEDIDFVYLGCPFYNIVEIQNVARLLEGKKCKSPVWVVTNPLTYKAATDMGLKDTIHKAGGVLLSGACCGLLAGEMPEAAVMATDAAKQDYYITGIVYPKKLEVRYGTTKDCVEAAISGKWKGQWR
ncbi:MAG: aconitase X [Syntrophorhabdales bacterium]